MAGTVMTTKQVDISNLKKEIIGYMSTGYDGDKRVCIDILNLVDKNIQKEESIEKRLEYAALRDGGTRGLEEYILMRDINNSQNQSERDRVLERLHNWFENYCEGNEEPDLWVAFLHAERALHWQAGEP
jgi:hypothetical protein